MPRSSASRLTAVGERRVSMGPPIRIIERGVFGSFSASMRAMAAITGTAGWQTAITCRSGPKRAEHVDQVIDVIVEIEAALGQRHHAGIRPIGDHHLVGRQESLDGAAQQGRVMARHGRHDQELRLGLRRLVVAIERDHVAEGPLPDDPLGDRDFLSVDRRGGEARSPACRSAGWSARTIRMPPSRCGHRAFRPRDCREIPAGSGGAGSRARRAQQPMGGFVHIIRKVHLKCPRGKSTLFPRQRDLSLFSTQSVKCKFLHPKCKFIPLFLRVVFQWTGKGRDSKIAVPRWETYPRVHSSAARPVRRIA